MALKALMTKKRLDEKRAALAELEKKDAEFEKREADLTEAFNELDDTSTDSEKETVSEAMDQYDADKEAHEEAKKNLAREIADVEAELAELEKKASDHGTEQETGTDERNSDIKEKRGTKMIYRTRMIREMTAEQRNAFAERDDIKAFAENIRALSGRSTRAITGGEVLIPTEILPIVDQEVYGASRLLGLVNRQSVAGKARQPIAGAIPEGIWVEACDDLNELKLAFTDVEVDAYKIGGYIPVCNELLRAADIDLVDEVISKLAEGIAYGLDKAIVYGTGTKMPTGFATNATKVNVSGKTDLALYKAFIEATGQLNHSRGNTLWAMNRKTRMAMVAASMSISASGAIVAGTQGTMPVEGGSIVELDFVPDNEIVGGYGMNYVLAEREGTAIASSEHAMFREDKTVFRGTALYDGKPVFNDAFLAIGLAGDPTGAIDASHPFASAT